jgi:molecular chaperone HtpG
MAEAEVKTGAGSEEKLAFGAEVSRLLHLMVHSVYSEKEIFLRELVSNASDACDRLRYAALTQADLMAGSSELKVVVTPNKKAKTLTIADNGIGMNRDDLIENLGTIARSGTRAFFDNMTGDDNADVSLIGQFGIGFYSAFMVADKVDVVSRKAGETSAWHWSSDGLGEYTVGEGERDERGTTVVLHVRKDQKNYLEPAALRQVVKTHSDHIALPVVLAPDHSAKEENAETETLNSASALWTRQKKEITEEQYKEFYNHVGHTFDTPSLIIHYRAEGKIEYSVLLFVPTVPPLDLFEPTRKSHLKLYVRRVFITDDCDELVPPYLRFLRGVVDSEDLPLNMSREMLQNNPVIARIRSAVTKRVLTDLGKKAKKDPEGYAAFWNAFGAVLKEGIYEDFERRDKLLELARFRSTASGDKLMSLAD